MERGFEIFLLESLSKFRFGINPYDFMGYIQYYYPYKYDPADPFEGFESYIADLHNKQLVEGSGERIWISEKGRKLVADFNKKYFSYDIVKFYQQCLDNSNPVAPVDLIYDSQTVKLLEEIFIRCNSPSIIDYGCGKMRVLNALLTNKHNKSWSYIGADTHHPKEKHILEWMQLKKIKTDKDWSVIKIDELRSRSDQTNIFVIMNVLHELSIVDFATALEDARQCLTDSGLLLIIDTIFIREGEQRFVPIFPWEMGRLFKGYEDKSYKTNSGIPIAFYVIKKEELPFFPDVPQQLYLLMAEKVKLLIKLTENFQHENNKQILDALGIGVNKLFDYGYINTIVANANFRIEEYNLYRIKDDIDKAGHKIITWLVEQYDSNHSFPSPIQIFRRFSSQFSYSAISYVFKLLTGIRPIFFKHMPDEPLIATENFDILYEVIGLEKIRQLGLRIALLEIEKYRQNQ